MAQPHWALKNIHQEVTDTGYEILVWSFQPCHLWMRWTTLEPQEHIVPRIIRGLSVPSDKRFCFVAYHDNEQEEGGDTYLHTFIKEPWPHCQTRWFYFHGRVGSEHSPSTSAIFKKHRIQPLVDHEFPHFGAGRVLEHYAAGWPGPWDDPVATNVLNSATFTDAGIRGWTIFPYIYRGPLLFDTLDVPPDANLVSGFIRCYCYLNRTTFVGYIATLQNGQPDYPHIPVVKADYDKDHYSGSGGSISSDDITSGSLFDLPLSSQGLTWINKGGITKFMLRTEHDITGQYPYPSDFGTDVRLTIGFAAPYGGPPPVLHLTY